MNAIGQPVSHQIIRMDNEDLIATNRDARIFLEPQPGPKQQPFWPWRLRSCFRLLRELAPDCLITYNSSTLDWALANLPLGLPHVHIEDSLNHEERQTSNNISLWKHRCALAPHSHIIVSSRTSWSRARNDWRIPDARVHYIPNGVEAALFAAPDDAAVSRPPVLPENKLRIGTTAPAFKDADWPNPIDVFLALESRDQCHLLIRCPEDQQEPLQKRIEAEELSDKITLSRGPAALPGIYPGLDIWLCTGRASNMPVSVLHAMAAGLPIVAPDTGDLKYMVGDCNKHLLAKPDARALAAALNELAGDSALRRRIGIQNERRIDLHFSDRQMTKAFSSVLTDLVAALPSGPPIPTDPEPRSVRSGRTFISKG